MTKDPANKTLMQIVQDSSDIMQKIMESQGEITDEIGAYLEDIEKSLTIKTDSYAHVMDKMKLESGFWKKRSDQFLAVSKSIDTLNEALKKRIKYCMEKMKKDEVVGNDFKFLVCNSKPSIAYEEKEIPDNYKIQTVVTTIDKEAIQEDLAMGIKIKGVTVTENRSLRKYVNREASKKTSKKSKSNK